jgi:hypothetical protein
MRSQRFPNSDMSRYAIPRGRPFPRPHPRFGEYRLGRYPYSSSFMYDFYWRPFRDIWGYRYLCVPGHWELDDWCNCWVWIEGYCNIPGHYHFSDPNFYFWFNFRR